MDLSVLWSRNITSSALQEKMTSTKEVKTKAVSIVEYLSVNLKVFFLTTYSLLYLPCTYAGFFPPVVPTSKRDLGQTLGQWEDFQRCDKAMGWQAPKIYMKNTICFNWMQE